MGQYENIMDAFDNIERRLTGLETKVMQLIHMQGPSIRGRHEDDLELFEETPSVASGMDTAVASGEGSPRLRWEYKDINGESQTVAVRDLDDRIVQMVSLAKQLQQPWQLWETEDGTIRLMTSDEVVQEFRSRIG